MSSRFEVVMVEVPATQRSSFWLVPGTILDRNGVRYRIVGSCKGRRQLLLRRLGGSA